MSQELLAIIEQIEREKGIKKETLMEAVETALLSAARKVIDVKPGEELEVQQYLMKRIMVQTIASQRATIFTNAHPGLCKPKKIIDQRALRIS